MPEIKFLPLQQNSDAKQNLSDRKIKKALFFPHSNLYTKIGTYYIVWGSPGKQEHGPGKQERGPGKHGK